MRKTLLAAVAGAAAAAALAGGFAWATIPSSTGVIKACYQKNNGQLRVVDSFDACSSSELAIQWNQAGPQGTTGPRGPQGTTGGHGPQGTTGLQGVRGPTGLQGIQGEHGLPGRDGVDGGRGPTGTTGTGGPQGQPGPTGPAGEVPVTPPAPYQFRDSANQLNGTFSVQLGTTDDAVRVSSFAGCVQPSIGALPGNCYFTVRGLPASLVDWLNDSLAGNPDAIRDLIVRGPFTPLGGTPDVQFELQDAFIASATVDVSAGSSAVGTVDLVVAANHFGAETPTPGPDCSCDNSFFENNFSFDVNGTRAVLDVEGMNFTVPRLGTTEYLPGTPAFHDLRVSVGNSSSSSTSSARTFFKAWAQSEENIPDRRLGTMNLLSPSLSTILASIDFHDLEPVTPFDPMFVGGTSQSITLRPAGIHFHS